MLYIDNRYNPPFCGPKEYTVSMYCSVPTRREREPEPDEVIMSLTAAKSPLFVRRVFKIPSSTEP